MKNKKTLRLVILFLVLCLTLGTLIVYDNFKIDVTEYAIESVDLPKNFDGFKIVHLSD
jgi:predicted MPP superfamily phosphohydrolase